MTFYEQLRAFIEAYESDYGDTPLTPAQYLQASVEIALTTATAVIVFHEQHRHEERSQEEWAELIREELGLPDAFLSLLQSEKSD